MGSQISVAIPLAYIGQSNYQRINFNRFSIIKNG